MSGAVITAAGKETKAEPGLVFLELSKTLNSETSQLGHHFPKDPISFFYLFKDLFLFCVPEGVLFCFVLLVGLTVYHICALWSQRTEEDIRDRVWGWVWSLEFGGTMVGWVVDYC